MWNQASPGWQHGLSEQYEVECRLLTHWTTGIGKAIRRLGVQKRPLKKTAHLLAGWGGAMRAFSVPRHETGAPQAAMKPGSLRAR
jgi:hypothetical protein